jgi:hypothetical protein
MYRIVVVFLRPRDMGLKGKPAPAPSTTGGVLQAQRLRVEVQKTPQTFVLFVVLDKSTSTHCASRYLDTLFSAARAHASLANGRALPPTSLPRAGTDPMSISQPFHSGVSAKVATRAASLAAVGEYRRAMETLKSNPVASGRGVHEELP